MRCFRLEAVQVDGVDRGYRLALRGELCTVAEGVPQPDPSTYGAPPACCGLLCLCWGGRPAWRGGSSQAVLGRSSCRPPLPPSHPGANLDAPAP